MDWSPVLVTYRRDAHIPQYYRLLLTAGTVLTESERVRGPSHSIIRIDCHVPNARSPSRTGMETLRPSSDVRRCASAFPSSASCAHPSGSERVAINCSMSLSNCGSASLIDTPAVVCLGSVYEHQRSPVTISPVQPEAESYS